MACRVCVVATEATVKVNDKEGCGGAEAAGTLVLDAACCDGGDADNVELAESENCPPVAESGFVVALGIVGVGGGVEAGGIGEFKVLAGSCAEDARPVVNEAPKPSFLWASSWLSH